MPRSKKAPSPPLLTPRFATPEDCHQWLKANGINLAELARKNKLPRHVFMDLLRGKRKGNYGQAHQAAIVLGLKADPKLLEQAA